MKHIKVLNIIIILISRFLGAGGGGGGGLNQQHLRANLNHLIASEPFNYYVLHVYILDNINFRIDIQVEPTDICMMRITDTCTVIVAIHRKKLKVC